MLKITLGLSLLLFSFFSFADEYFDSPFPRNPNLEITPGKLCTHADQNRYPEQIAYCMRNVTPETKDIVIKKYDDTFGFRIESMKRGDFKIDHLIPLCMGGDNDESNLWPQHKSIYKITDPVEPALCNLMQQGKILQKDAVKIIIFAKTNLDKVPAVMKYLGSLYSSKPVQNPIEEISQ